MKTYYAEVEAGSKPNFLVPIAVTYSENAVLIYLKGKAENWIRKHVRDQDLIPGEIKLNLGPYSMDTREERG